MPQSSIRDVGRDVHQEALAGTAVAQDHGAEVVSLGTLGTRPYDLETRIRPRPSQATHLICVYRAGPLWQGRGRSFQAPAFQQLVLNGMAWATVPTSRQP
jgi:hypothetical protein